jgi:hypothetical protein
VRSSEPPEHWWIPSGRRFYSPDAAQLPAQELAYASAHFFLPHRFHDQFGNRTLIRYDGYDLLVVDTTDAAGNRVTAGDRAPDGGLITTGNDYRVLKPRLVMEANRNRVAVAFDALGQVVGTATMGKPEEQLGDSLDGFEPDLADLVAAAQLADPLADPTSILAQATTRTVYDLFAYHRTRNEPAPQPAVVATLSRETHAADLPDGAQPRVLHNRIYSDGFGREIQRKALVEPGPIVDGGAEQDPRWVTTGWTVVNNKGAPVRQYEPFFSSTHGFEFGYAIGVSPVLGYDPLDRLVATLTPHDCYEKVVFDPWHSVRSDAIDTVLDDPRADPDVSGYLHAYLAIHIGWQTWHARRAGGALGPAELAAAVAAAAHARTPTTAYLDSLGRTFLVVADGGSGGVVATRTELDITGVARRVVDARGVQVLCQDADLVGSILHTDSPDAGQRWTLPDVLGATVRGWDSRGQALRRTYDALRRPVELWVRGPDDVADILAQLTRYGEEHPEATERNLRGRPYLAFDCAGLATALEHDFKGNLLTGRRELAQTYHATPDWSALAGLTLSEVENAAATLLAGEPFTTSTDFDALNRTVLRTLPDTTALLPAYNEARLLESVSAQLPGAALATPFVTDLDYDARGQRRLLEYGNGTHSAYEYDPAPSGWFDCGPCAAPTRCRTCATPTTRSATSSRSATRRSPRCSSPARSSRRPPRTATTRSTG